MAKSGKFDAVLCIGAVVGSSHFCHLQSCLWEVKSFFFSFLDFFFSSSNVSPLKLLMLASVPSQDIYSRTSIAHG
jgi:hypothetical protein